MDVALQPDQIEIVLVSPRNPLNIGAAARAMANFGFSRLTVAAPYEENWREAKSAVGAEELLATARHTHSLAEAVAECTLVLGTATTDRRQPEQTVASLPQIGKRLASAMGADSRIALVFGSEKHGLTREELSYCHVLVEIPTDPRQPSMNLGQAVAVCLYELSRYNADALERPERSAEVAAPIGSPGNTAASADLELLASMIDQTMQEARYSPGVMFAANRHDLRLFLRRLSLTSKDSRRVLGLFRRILWKLRHPHS